MTDQAQIAKLMQYLVFKDGLPLHWVLRIEMLDRTSECELLLFDGIVAVFFEVLPQ